MAIIDPATFVRVAGSLLPRQVELDERALYIISDKAHGRRMGRHILRSAATFNELRKGSGRIIAERISPLLADNGLIMVQTEKSRHLIEQTDKGLTLSIVYAFSFINEEGECSPEIEWTALARL
jgi:hypothetical protein